MHHNRQLPPPDPLYDVEVVGPVHAARFPGLCAGCGRAARGTLPVRKLFWNDGGEGSPFYAIGAVDAPFCERCVAAHAREAQPIPADVRRKLLRGWFVFAVLLAFPMAGLLFMAGVAGRALLRALDGHAPLWALALTGGVCAFFLMCAFGVYAAIRRKGRQLIHEQGVRSRPRYVRDERGPFGARLIVETTPTSTECAVDFSDDCSAPFEGERHRFTFRNAEVAARFAELNGDRAWSPTSPRAHRAKAAQWVAIAVLLAAAVAALVFGKE